MQVVPVFPVIPVMSGRPVMHVMSVIPVISGICQLGQYGSYATEGIFWGQIMCVVQIYKELGGINFGPDIKIFWYGFCKQVLSK